MKHHKADKPKDAGAWVEVIPKGDIINTDQKASAVIHQMRRDNRSTMLPAIRKNQPPPKESGKRLFAMARLRALALSRGEYKAIGGAA